MNFKSDHSILEQVRIKKCDIQDLNIDRILSTNKTSKSKMSSRQVSRQSISRISPDIFQQMSEFSDSNVTI